MALSVIRSASRWTGSQVVTSRSGSERSASNVAVRVVASSSLPKERPALKRQRIVRFGGGSCGDGLNFAYRTGERKSWARNQGRLDTSLCRPEKRVKEAKTLNEHYIRG